MPPTIEIERNGAKGEQTTEYSCPIKGDDKTLEDFPEVQKFRKHSIK